MRRALISAALGLALASGPLSGPAVAQDQTLADIRQELSVLFVELQRLKRELSTTGAVPVTVGGDTLTRVDLIESELQRLTAMTERMQHRIDSVVRDGTNRVGDLEFRLCELEPDCDIATLSETSTLGGGETPVVAVTPTTTTPADTTQFAVGEEADFDRARQALDGGEYRDAADRFAAFTQTYPGGPLSAEAHYLRGEALAELGETSTAARAYLDSYSGDPNGAHAAASLLRLGESLGDLGQTSEACVMLEQVGARFPGAAEVPEAEAELSRLGCL